MIPAHILNPPPPGGRPLNRVAPKLSNDRMQTHTILAPLQTHWRKATCEEVACKPFLEGYGVPLKGLDADDLALLESFIKVHKMKASKVEITDGEWHYWFAPGQRCLRASSHVRRLDREEIFLVRNGDWRGTDPTQDPITFSSADSWADHLGTHLDKFKE